MRSVKIFALGLFLILSELPKNTIARKVAALDDICSRGSYSFCRNQQAVPAAPVPVPSSSAVRSGTSRDVPPPAPAAPPVLRQKSPLLTATPPPLPAEPSNAEIQQYCFEFYEHYKYYCGAGGSSAKDARASEFCPTYNKYCDATTGGIATTPAPMLPPARIQQLCVEFEPMANQYCFRPTIPKNVRKDCELYLKNCLGESQPQTKSAQQTIRETIKPCDKYYNDYVGFCVQNPTPYNANVADFCRNYKGTCVPAQLPNLGALNGQGAEAASQQSMQPQLQPVQQPQMQQPVAQQQQFQPTAAQMAQMNNGGRPIGITGNEMGAIGGNPWAGAGSPVGSMNPMGNPDMITNPVGSLGGNPDTVTNPLGALGASPTGGGWQSAMPGGMAGQNPAASGMAAHPLTLGQQTSVGQMAGVSRGASINPFGQVGTGTTVNGGPVSVSSGRSVDFSGIPGLSQLGSLPGLGKRRRRQSLLFPYNLRDVLSA